MTDDARAADLPASYHVMLRAAGATDFHRAGVAQLDAAPRQGSVIELSCDGRALRGLVEAVFIPPGCEENCVGTIFLAER